MRHCERLQRVADTTLPVVAAVISALGANTALQAILSGRIYTDVPQGCPFPYLKLSLTSEPFAASDFSGQTHTLTLQAFSREATLQEVARIRQLALDTLDRQESNILLSSGTLVKCEYSGSLTPFQEDDGKTWQAVGELEIVVV